MYTNEQFREAFDKVFDSEGNIKACGRVACKELIYICNTMDSSGTKYGDIETGYMNVELIKRFNENITKHI